MRSPRILAGALACSLVCAGTALGASGVLSGTVKGLPAHPGFAAVTAVNAQGEIGGVATPTPGGSYHLSLPAGTWIIFDSAANPACKAATTATCDTTLTAGSAPVRVAAGASEHLKPAKAHPAAVSSHGPPLKPGSVVTVSTVYMADYRPQSIDHTAVNYSDVVENELFSLCGPRGIIFVDTSAAFRKFAQQEAGLSAAGRLSTPFSFHPVAAKYIVTARDQALQQGAADLGLAVAPASTGNVFLYDLVDWDHDDTTDIPTDADVLDVVHQAASALAKRMCGA